ncbi:alpha/beta-hydrolase [Crucibulum laeve]|uniref:Alpha/beta-hydrolase n=1 Tax=Crucibulum laeve TaxID=68775 RepID=A0A5C3LRU2_9AGAR|nr:alpha/beta-hydrolase [Crucibulum laeve]
MHPPILEKILSSTDGTKIYARAVGNSQKLAIMFVHGLALSSSVFDKLFMDERLLDEFFLVSYDMRGHGGSGKPETMEGHVSSLYAADFAAVVQAFDIKQPPILVGWSLGATAAADVCEHLGANALSAIVYVCGLPYTGAIMNEVGTPFILGLLPGLFSTDDVALLSTTKITFVDSLFNDPARVPRDFKWSLLGSTIAQFPIVSQLVLSRPQDPTKLHEAGAKGLPLLLLSGSADKQVNGDVVVTAMAPFFNDIDVKNIPGGSHILFYDAQDEFVKALLKFAIRVRKSTEFAMKP